MASSLVLLGGDLSLNPGPGGAATGPMIYRNLQFSNSTFSARWRTFAFYSVISETLLNSSIRYSGLSIHGYTLERHDRTSIRSGGTAIYVRDTVPFKHRVDLTVENIETRWVEVNRPKQKTLNLSGVSTDHQTFVLIRFIDQLNSLFTKLLQKSDLMILGYFN